MTEYLLSVNEYGQPKKLSDKDAIFTLLVRLLLLDPGKIPTHPDMGVGLYSKWHYAYIDELPKLKAEISRQIQQYLPELQGVSVNLTQSEPYIVNFEITVSNTLYKFKTNSDNHSIAEITNKGDVLL